jgi:hypothetical protein
VVDVKLISAQLALTATASGVTLWREGKPLRTFVHREVGRVGSGRAHAPASMPDVQQAGPSVLAATATGAGL